MRNISIHTPSALAGFGLAALVGITMAQSIVGSPSVDVRVIEPVVAYSPAHPREFVRIDEGTPYTVPSGRLLVVKSLGASTPSGVGGMSVELHVNGQVILESGGVGPLGAAENSNGSAAYRIFEPGLVVPAGAVLDVVDPFASTYTAVALGYLADD